MKTKDNMDNYLNKLVELIDFSKPDSIQTLIYDGLREWIISGIVPLGYHLNEVHLSKTLNISRTPIREAIKKLTYEGFLEYLPNIGTIVKTITREDALEVYQLRVALETLVFTAAMNNMGDSDFESLEVLLQKTMLAHQSKKIDEVIHLTSEFNEKIRSLADMPRLTELLRNLKDYLHRFRVIAMTSEDRGKQAIVEHGLIVRAMRNKDETQIECIVKEHLSYSLNCILGYLDEIA